jgi:ABC-type transporter lipoprotein component MlaA
MMEHTTVNEMAGKYLELPTVAHLYFRDSCAPAYEDEEDDTISAAEATAVVLVPRNMPNVECLMEPAAAVARQWHLVRRALARYTILRYEYSEHHEEHEEDLIFLNINQRFWNEATVREALGKL